jgi:hypothetical protein
MRLNSYVRRFHDPWGNKRYNRRGSICRHQYMVGKAELSSYESPQASKGTEAEEYYFDGVRATNEQQGDRFVKGPHSVETVRR